MFQLELKQLMPGEYRECSCNSEQLGAHRRLSKARIGEYGFGLLVFSRSGLDLPLKIFNLRFFYFLFFPCFHFK